ncbi:hypothetical protein [Lysobacter auxotrophicus]|uniref:Uncharacterized protein n=1 Tax=Lysobacter auxotrophicus TaxID=2992573 RepID=A0ABM8DG30_9GAMM|nr:hypothetical protein [Lysobacter auxotrophicus]BDU17562.1 hypothetical protein LA521A_27630 [Lysobacter auxotrophicus]
MNQIDPYATLRAAHASGARIQVWRLRGYTDSSADGHWVDITPKGKAPAFTCPAHLYRVHPEDAANG